MRDEVRSWAEKREADQMRYITNKSQEIADIKKKAGYYDEYVNSNEYAQFKQWNQTPQQPTQSNPPAVNELQELGYSDEEASKLSQIFDKRVDQRIAQKEKEFTQKINTIQEGQSTAKAKQDIADLANLHPDVYDLIESGALQPFVTQYCTKENKPFEVAYQKCTHRARIPIL